MQDGLGFAVVWGLAMWFVDWRHHTSPLAAVGCAALSGALFGLWTAWFTRRRRKARPQRAARGAAEVE